MKSAVSIFALSCWFVYPSFAQDVNVKLGGDQIALNQYFTITLEIRNDRIRSWDGFPEIKGFEMVETSSSSFTNIVNGQVTSVQSITQNYAPTKEGIFKIPPFTVTINDKPVKSAGKIIKVGPVMTNQKRYDPRHPFEEFYDENEPVEFVEMKDDAFLAVNVDKDEVFVGEGFTVDLAFYVTEENLAEFAWHDVSRQISEIVKKIKPENCWEENFNIENMEGKKLKINDKMTTQFKLYQATFFPLNNEPVEFPSVGLKMVKYLRAKNPSLFSSNKKEDFKTFYSSPKTVKVALLPLHPLKEHVAVGRYEFSENISSRELKTGESFNYSFTIIGEGNISNIREPDIKENEAFDFYPPNTEVSISRGYNKVRGSKSFEYYSIPNEPGEYELGELVNWVYFDPAAEKYDTLRSDIVVSVLGESKKNEVISSSDPGDFYELIKEGDNTLSNIGRDKKRRLITNILLIATLAFSTFFIFRKH